MPRDLTKGGDTVSFSIRNVRKFFDDHPEYGVVREGVESMAEAYAIENVVSGQHINIFGRLTPQFRSEILTDQAHIDAWVEDVSKISGLEAMVDLSLAFWKDIAKRSNGIICSIGNSKPGKLEVIEKEKEWEFRHPAFGDKSLTIYKSAGSTTPADMGMIVLREVKKE